MQNSSGGIFERSTLRQPDYSVLGCMVSCSASNTDQTANRRVVNDGAASLLAHLAQLVFHAVPDPPQIDPVHTLEFFAADISHFNGWRLYPSVVERRIEATKGGYSLRDHRCYFNPSSATLHRMPITLCPVIRSRVTNWSGDIPVACLNTREKWKGLKSTSSAKASTEISSARFSCT